jgi:polysaccharide deacetylase 2 family uncharacterized protein YibQ
MTVQWPKFSRRIILRGCYLVAILPLCVAFALEPVPEPQNETVVVTPMIALIIDDLGNQRLPGLRAIALDAPIACAIMPHTAHSTYLANKAHASGKEVILHLPMQPTEMNRIAGPGEISLDNDRAELKYILKQNLLSVPHSVGVSNHMGSLVTRHPGHMRWLMQELADNGDLFFVDSFTTPDSVAYTIALETGIPAARRHIFLDNVPTTAAIEQQVKRLKQHAKNYGYAIGIGHPYPATLDYLQTALPEFEKQGFKIVPVTQIITLIETMATQPTLASELPGAAQSAVVHVH